jgi:hypothetical protein
MQMTSSKRVKHLNLSLFGKTRPFRFFAGLGYSNSDAAQFAAAEMCDLPVAMFYFCISKARGTARFLLPYFYFG